MTKLYFSLILPCFNEGPTFEASISKIFRQLKKYKKNYEIIFIDDKSTDNTKKSIQNILKSNQNCRAVFHSKNIGRGGCVSEGIRLSKANICGYMDVDCEVSPSYVSIFVNEIKNGNDLAVGKRFYEMELRSLHRFVSSKAYVFVIKHFLDLPISDTECGYKFFNKKNIIKIMNSIQDKRWFWDTEICARSYWSGLKITEVPVIFTKRMEKKSTVRLIPDSIEYLKKLIEFRSELPRAFKDE